jgi:hypothetical protein
MSRENVEPARVMHEAFNRWDTEFVVDQLHAELEWEEDTAAFPGIEPGAIARSGQGGERGAPRYWPVAPVVPRMYLANDHPPAAQRLTGGAVGCTVARLVQAQWL